MVGITISNPHLKMAIQIKTTMAMAIQMGTAMGMGMVMVIQPINNLNTLWLESYISYKLNGEGMREIGMNGKSRELR